MKLLLALLIAGLLGVTLGSQSFAETPNSLSAEEHDAGFELLFDGESFEGWRHAGNWKIDDGVLTREGKGGSLVYSAKKIPDDFELRFDWKVAKGSNSGVYYRPGQYEYQILDNAVHVDGKNPRTSAASIYFCMAPSHDATNPVGEWNEGRIVCKGTVVQHWLNGTKVVHLDYADAKWKDNVELLRLRGGDLAARGANLSLQDHGDPVWYRSIKLRTLGADDQLDSTPVVPAELTAEVQREEQAKLKGIIERRRKIK
ncbi:MAG: DUF1080 domain-containing protein [Planctomycetes bacterium]|nr:DUF1080 domain-containing protein [Planctomycetota bacterium]